MRGMLCFLLIMLKLAFWLAQILNCTSVLFCNNNWTVCSEKQLLCFLLKVDNHYDCHAILSDVLDRLLISIFHYFFGGIFLGYIFNLFSNQPFETSCGKILVHCSPILVIGIQIHDIFRQLFWIEVCHVFIVRCWISVGNVWNAVAHSFFNKLKHVNIYDQVQSDISYSIPRQSWTCKIVTGV